MRTNACDGESPFVLCRCWVVPGGGGVAESLMHAPFWGLLHQCSPAVRLHRVSFGKGECLGYPPSTFYIWHPLCYFVILYNSFFNYYIYIYLF